MHKLASELSFESRFYGLTPIGDAYKICYEFLMNGGNIGR